MEHCKEYRTNLALRPDGDTAELSQHAATCPECAKAAKRAAAFDTVVQSAVMPMVPDDLTARLLALVPGLAQPMVRSKRWLRQRRAFFAISALLSVIGVAVLIYGLYILGSYVGVSEIWHTVQAWPGQALDWLYRTVPASRDMAALLLKLYQPLQWALVLVLLWLMFDRLSAAPAEQQMMQSS